MARNWGLSTNDERRTLRDAQTAKPVLTLLASFVFGVVGASVAVLSFSLARGATTDLFQGFYLLLSVIAAGFGAWGYVWLALPRFAAQFRAIGDPFSKLIRFYLRAAILLVILTFIGRVMLTTAPNILTTLVLCISGGAGAAAAFQTVLAFVPNAE
ncbi:MAG: hypothetical protein AAGC77_04280 [Pseudomonadota bacterium]